MIPRKGGFEHKFNIIKDNKIKINFHNNEQIKKSDRRKSKRKFPKI